MHELSLALSLVAGVEEARSAAGGARVVAVRLRAGELCGVSLEALGFAYAAAVAGTELEGSRVEFERVAAAGECVACGGERRPVSVFELACAECGAPLGRLTRGLELETLGLVVEEEEPEAAAERYP